MDASDLHFTVGSPPMVRNHGSLVPLDGYPPMTASDIENLMASILDDNQRRRFQETNELDLAYSLGTTARFRVNVFRQKATVAAALRHIPRNIRGVEQLGLPAVVADFAYLSRGLVLVTGPTGSGKSTTLAGLLDLANRSRAGHIVTIEDPIEYIHEHRKCIVNQREVGSDTVDFGEALKRALRQDPDIILIGELRDLETTSVALTAAETGHLVFATLHTQDAAQTIDRLIDIFPAGQQQQIRVMVAATLHGRRLPGPRPAGFGQRSRPRRRGHGRDACDPRLGPGGQDPPARLGDADRRRHRHGDVRQQPRSARRHRPDLAPGCARPRPRRSRLQAPRRAGLTMAASRTFDYEVRDLVGETDERPACRARRGGADPPAPHDGLRTHVGARGRQGDQQAISHCSAAAARSR